MLEASPPETQGDNLDTDTETVALLDFIRLKWGPLPDIEGVLCDIRDTAFHDGRAHLDDYQVWRHAYDLRKRRQIQLCKLMGEEPGSLAALYDAGCHFFNETESHCKDVADAAMALDGKWSFSRQADELHSRLVGRWPGLAKLTPQGYDNAHKQLEKCLVKNEYALFQGTLYESPGALNFVERISLPSVMYEVEDQGNSASRVLVGAVYTQFLLMAQSRNTVEVCHALTRLADRLVPEMMFELRHPMDNPFLEIIQKTGSAPPSQAEYLLCKERTIAFNSLSQEEQNARKQSNTERILQNLRNDMTESEARRNCLKERIAVLMREKFPH